MPIFPAPHWILSLEDCILGDAMGRESLIFLSLAVLCICAVHQPQQQGGGWRLSGYLCGLALGQECDFSKGI